MRISRRRFDALVREAVRSIPREFRRHLENVDITVQDRPDRRDGPPDLLGLYVGVSLLERSVMDTVQFPDQILVFQRPTEAICETEADIVREVRITVIHEVAHHLGFTDEEIEAIMGE